MWRLIISSLPAAHQRNRIWPVVCAHFQRDFVVALFDLSATLGHGGGESLHVIRVLHPVAGLKFLELRPEDFLQDQCIFGLGGRLQCFYCLVR